MTAWIRSRKTKAGELRYHVQYRRGGRGWPVEHAGAFKVLREAKLRRDVVGGWLAQGLNPKAELAELLSPPEPKRLLKPTYDAWLLSRHDVTDGTQRAYEFAYLALERFFGADQDLEAITVSRCREYMGWLAERYKPATVDTYWSPFPQVMDFAEVEPNPARHATIKKPMNVRAEHVPMTRKQFEQMVAKLPEKYRLFYRMLEATGMRIGELYSLTWGDVDFAESRFRVSVRRTKSHSGQRWVQVPQSLMEQVALSRALEDRVGDDRVFWMVSANAAKAAMRRACQLAGIPHFHPHDLRHRRLSLWHAQGVTARELASRAGHSKASMTLDVYSHVVIDAKDDEWA